MSMYSRLEPRQAALQNYLERHTKILFGFLNSALTTNHPLLQTNNQGNDLIVFVATSKGLCGSLNANLFRHFEQTTHSERKNDISFITIGQKAKRYITEKGFSTVICHYNELNAENYRSLTNDLIDRIFGSKQHYTSITFYSSQLRGFFKQIPLTTHLTPLSDNTDINQVIPDHEKNNLENNHHEQDMNSWIWEQPNTEIFDHLISSYLKAHVSKILYDSLLAEHAARFFAMDNSTTNAHKLLDHLSLQYNKQRQMSITKEVAELSSTLPQEDTSY